MEDLVKKSDIHQFDFKSSVGAPFEFERLLRVMSSKMEPQALANLNKFRQWEIKLNSTPDIEILNKDTSLLEQLKADYRSYIESTGDAKNMLSHAFQETPDPDQARGIWDAGREYDRRELCENTLVDLQNYIDKSRSFVNEGYTNILTKITQDNDKKNIALVSISHDKKQDEVVVISTPLQDVMNYKV